jgi:formylglycine-generating enzyme required for sulfatase activity
MPLLRLLILLCLVGPAPAQLLAVLDKSKPEDAGLSQAKLNILAQAARGEARRRIPEQFQVMSEENTITILRDMGVNLAACEGECEVEIARKLQADWLMSVQLVRFGSAWNLQLNLFETATGALKGSERAQVAQEDRLIAVAEEKTGLLALLVGRRSDLPASGRIGGGGEEWELPATVGVLVTFESTPPGATVTLDGSYLGETPITRELTPGPHSLKLSLSRYEDLVERVTVDKRAVLSRPLTPLFGWLTVESTPAAQPVWLDGVRAGDTPLRDHVLGHGPHVVQVGDSVRTYPVGERFALAKGERKTLSFDVLQRTGGLVVRLVDAQGNALEQAVTVDGTPRGNSPLQLKLPIGEHVVEADGKRHSVRVVEKEIESLVLTVERAAASPAGGQGVAGPLPGMTFVTLPAGSFQMGSTTGDEEEKPVHKVTLSSFALMTTEVTQAQWRAVMGNNPSHFKGEDLPVENVSWDDVQDFLRKLNKRDPGKNYRLPTEAEWEYACRAGSTAKWCFGNDESQLGDYAWYYANADGRTHPVGRKRANAWGLFDMHGNVWEWCQDWYGNYPSGDLTNPAGPTSGTSRVRRGGYWNADSSHARCAGRNYTTPAFRYYHHRLPLCQDSLSPWVLGSWPLAYGRATGAAARVVMRKLPPNAGRGDGICGPAPRPVAGDTSRQWQGRLAPGEG